MKSLYEKLINYGKSDFYGFHMPGHKRNGEIMENGLPYQIDITEIEGFDDLHHAKELLKEAQERAARVYHAEETCYLINGSKMCIRDSDNTGNFYSLNSYGYITKRRIIYPRISNLYKIKSISDCCSDIGFKSSIGIFFYISIT